jgi:hypothetical protein
MSPSRANTLSPLLALVVEVHNARTQRGQPREGEALRALAQLARVEIVTRGVLSPSEDGLQRVIDEIARAHLGLESATDELNEALGAVEALAVRDRVEIAMDQVRGIAEIAYFNAGFAFGVTFAELGQQP